MHFDVVPCRLSFFRRKTVSLVKLVLRLLDCISMLSMFAFLLTI
jgi:hypothetical protein